MPGSTKPTIETYRGKSRYGRRRYYWRLRSPEGEVVAVGGQGFPSRAHANDEALRAQRLFRRNPVLKEL